MSAKQDMLDELKKRTAKVYFKMIDFPLNSSERKLLEVQLDNLHGAMGRIEDQLEKELAERRDYELRLPRKFYEDHADRGLPAGEVVEWKTRAVYIKAAKEEILEILSDAAHYEHAVEMMGPEYRGLQDSASRTIGAIHRQYPEFRA